MSIASKPIEYVNNAEFLEHLNAYIKERDHNKEHDLPAPRIPEPIGKAFVQIATKLSNRYNFNGYTYKDEMVSDGILNAVTAINSFNPEKSQNPFAYFTQIIFWAFVRRIKSEKKEFAGRNSMMFDGDEDSFTVEHGDTHSVDKSGLFLFYNS